MVAAQLAELSKLGIGTDPAPGDIPAIHSTRDTLKMIAEGSKGILGRLDNLSTMTADGGWEGESARAYVEKFATLRTLLGHLERMHNDAYDVLADYANRLASLQREVAEALARARAHWNDQARAQREGDQHASTRRALRDQIARLRRESVVCTDPLTRQQVEAERQDAERRERVATRSEDSARDLVRSYERSLNAERDTLGEIRRRFLRIDEEAAARFRCLVPDALENQKAIFNFLRPFVDLLAGLRDLIAEVAEAIRKMFDLISLVLLGLVIVFAVLATLGVVAFPAVLLLLLTYASVIASAALVVVFILQLAGSDVGDPVGLVDLAFATLTLVPFLRTLKKIPIRTVPPGKDFLRSFHREFMKHKGPFAPLGARAGEILREWVPRIKGVGKIDDVATEVISDAAKRGLKTFVEQPLDLDDMAKNLREWVRGNPNVIMPRPILIPITSIPVLISFPSPFSPSLRGSNAW